MCTSVWRLSTTLYLHILQTETKTSIVNVNILHCVLMESPKIHKTTPLHSAVVSVSNCAWRSSNGIGFETVISTFDTSPASRGYRVVTTALSDWPSARRDVTCEALISTTLQRLTTAEQLSELFWCELSLSVEFSTRLLDFAGFVLYCNALYGLLSCHCSIVSTAIWALHNAVYV